MIRRLTGQLPTWARADHPVLRYELGRSARRSSRERWLRALGIVLLVLLLFGAGYLVATNLLTRPAGQSVTEIVNAVAFWPLLVLQILASIAALTLTTNTVGEEQRRQTWDNLRATIVGAELALRARWASVFYRLRGLLGLILFVRVLLILGILYDLTAFQGRYLDLLIIGVTPQVPLVVAVLLLSLLMTAGLLLPITAVGFDAAFGLLLSTVVRQRTYSALLQLLVIMLRIGMLAALLVGVTQFINDELLTTDLGAWLLMSVYSAVGDWGLAFLNLGFYAETWATIPYGILLGLALLAFSLAQAAIADGLLSLAVRRAERYG